MDKSIKIVEEATKVLEVPAKDPSRGPPEMSETEDDFESESGMFTNLSDEDMLARSVRSTASKSSCLHMLTSYREGESKVEKMATKIENRILQRVDITFNARRLFLKHCRRIATEKQYPKLSRILYSDVLAFREEIKAETDDNDAEGIFTRVVHWCGVLNDKQCLAHMLDKAKAVGESIDLKPEDDFHYQDFNHHHTVLVSRWPWMRHELLFAMIVVFCFYLITPILFCLIMHDEGICPQDTKVPGWVSALYFASTTMSTVGYGDLSVEKDEYWKVIIGMLYMIVSVLVALTALSAAAETAASPIKALVKRIAQITPLRYPEGPLKENEYIYQRIRKVRAIMLCDIAFQFLMLNLIGIFASQIFIEYTETDPERQWDWIDSLYWAVQTTTTIGYGDYSMPVLMRPFQIFYLSLSTYFTGNALGKFATLKHDIDEIRRQHAFARREINQNMMHYMASTDDASRVDQYEFVIASLLNLRKITSDDIVPIMDKYRSLARTSGHCGYIRVSAVPEETDINFEELTEVEGLEGA